MKKFRSWLLTVIVMSTLLVFFQNFAGTDVLYKYGAYLPTFYLSMPASNESHQIVTHVSPISDTAAYNPTHLMRLDGSGTVQNVEIAPSERGGGYIGFATITPRGGVRSGNIVSYLFGRGWQSSIRDDLHSRVYNPTQAGFRDSAGTTANLSARAGENGTATFVSVNRFNAALWTSDSRFDYVAKENLVPDVFPDDGRNSDQDGLNELSAWNQSSYDQDDEIRSEFDYAGVYENIASSLDFGNRIPTLRHRYFYAYARAPKAILQFSTATAKYTDGTPVLNTNFLANSFSNSSLTALPGLDLTKIKPNSSDLSSFYNPWNFRITDSALALRHYYYRKNNSWVVAPIPVDRSAFVRTRVSPEMNNPPFRYSGTFPEEVVGLMVVSTSADENSGTAIGLYLPNSLVQRKSVVGRSPSTGNLAYADNRLISMGFGMSRSTDSSQTVVSVHRYFSGIFNPTHPELQGRVAEALYGDVIMLFGTPNEILAAVNNLKRLGE